MRLKTVRSEDGETVKVINRWAAEVEVRGDGLTITDSDWEVTGSLTLGATVLVGTTTTALITVEGEGTVTNTITISNGETVVGVRDVKR